MREQAPVRTSLKGVPPPLPRPLTQGAGKRNERGSMSGADIPHTVFMQLIKGAKKAYKTLTYHRYSTVAGTLVFFLILSLVPFLFWLTLLFGSSLLEVPLENSGLFDWAEELLVLLRENAAYAGGGVSLVFLATTLWSSSAFFYHLRKSGEILYDTRRTENGWKVRISAILLTFAVLLFFALAGTLLFAASILSRYLSPWISYPTFYALLLALGFFGAWILNGYICPYKIGPSETALGSFLTALAWLIASGAFSVYLHFGNKEKLYGALAFLFIFLLWLYWMMLCFVAGAIFNRVKSAKGKTEERKL